MRISKNELLNNFAKTSDVELFKHHCANSVEVCHQHLHALVVYVLSAFNVVLLLQVWNFISQALFVQIFFGVTSLVLHHVIWDHDISKALLLAIIEVDILFVANIDAVVVGGIDNSFDALLKRIELLSVKCFCFLIHFKFY